MLRDGEKGRKERTEFEQKTGTEGNMLISYLGALWEARWGSLGLGLGFRCTEFCSGPWSLLQLRSNEQTMDGGEKKTTPPKCHPNSMRAGRMEGQQSRGKADPTSRLASAALASGASGMNHPLTSTRGLSAAHYSRRLG